MEKFSKFIIAMIIIVAIIIIALVVVLQFTQARVNDEIENPETVAFTDIEKISNKNLFYLIDYNLNNYFQYLRKQNQEAIVSISPINAVKLKSESNTNFRSQEMYVLDKITNITVYVYGVTRNKDIQNDYYLIINMDYNSNTFELVNSSKEEFEQARKNKISNQYKTNSTIQKNNYNEIQEKNITDLEVLKYYFEDYKYKALYEQEKAFGLLDKEYRKNKFNNNIEEYKSYIQNNLSKFEDANIVKHGITKNGQFGTYTLYDNFNNYYKVIETGINEYNIILDNYSSQTEEEVKGYNNLSDKEKVANNIDKIIKLINTKSYKELYQCLNSSFKNNYFTTQDKFENYIKQNFFDNNIVGNTTIENEGDIYIVTVSYKESLSSAAEKRKKTFYMKLEDNMNFSFSINIDN